MAKCKECEHATFFPGDGENGRYYCSHKENKTDYPMICSGGKMNARTSPKWCPIKKRQEAFDKEKFLTSAMGQQLRCMIKLWDEHLDKKMAVLCGIADCKNPDLELKIAFMIIDKCVAQWEVYQMMFKHFCDIDYHFNRTDTYFGICTEDESDWLCKFYKL